MDVPGIRSADSWFFNDSVNEFFSGAIGGLAGLVIGHPMDTVKTLMQNAAHTPTVIGMFYAVRQSGFKSFFKGLSIPLYSYGFVNAITFGTYKYSLRKLDPVDQSATACMLAGAISAIVQLIPAVPVELIKVQQQCVVSYSVPAPSVLQCMRTIIKNHGPCGLYTGGIAHACRDIPGLAVYFLVYTKLLQMQTQCGVNPFWSAYVAGGVSGALSWIVSIPFDVVKTRMQSGNLNSMSTVVRELVSQKDYQIFFRGFSVVMIRALLVNSTVFAVYEFTYGCMNRRRIVYHYNRIAQNDMSITD